MGVQKFLKRGAAVALCGALLAQPCLVAVSQAKDSTVLYTVNCGTPDPSVVPNGYSLGACQSRVDQAWGEDGETGYSWGYFSGDPYSVLVGTGSDATDLTKTSWYLSDQGEFVEETAGIEYHFQLPEDCTKVEVTVGVKIPQWWDDRTVAIELEGADAGQMSCADNVLSEETFVTSVTDGELNFRAKTVEPDNRKADPMLSYLIVEAVEDNGELDIAQATATTYAQGNEPAKALDGDPATHWHTSWSGDYPTVEDGLWLTLDLGEQVDDVSQLTYLPRQDKDTNGTYTKYEIYVSSDNQSYTKVAEGSWAGDKTEKTATFPAVSARYVRLQAVATKGNSAGEDNKFASAAEVGLFYGQQWDRTQAQAQLREALQEAEDYLQSDHGKTETELSRLNTMVEQARTLADSEYLAVKEEIGTLAEDLHSEVERLESDRPYQTYDTIFGTDCDGEQYLDNNGNVIQAHGGQIQKWGDTYYWYGEDKSTNYNPAGVHLYTSKDLYNWTDEGVVLKTMESMDQFTTDPYFSALYGDLSEEEQQEIFHHLDTNTAVVERPKVIYNESTDQYVLWFHADGPSRDGQGGAHSYVKAEAAVAVSDTPEGPFTLLGSYRLHTREGYSGNQGMARDMNLFVDEGVDANGDGVDDAYIIYSSEENQTMYISRLNADYTYLDKPQGEAVEGVDFTANFVGMSREAPAMFKYNDTYYLMTSGCTGWNPNPAQYATADSPMGPWTTQGNPCVDAGKETTYKSQSTCIVPVDPENGKYMYMGDRWYPPYNLPVGDSRYVWLPVDFGYGGTMTISDESNWKLEEELGRQPAFYVDGELNVVTDDFDSYVQAMPETLNIRLNSQLISDVPVTWTVEADQLMQGVMRGTLGGDDPRLAGRTFTVTVDVYAKNMVYFMDCNNPDSEYVSNLQEYADQLVNTVGDQPYDEASGWGYVGTIGSPQNNDGSTFGVHNGTDSWSSGWFAGPTKPLVYDVQLEAGKYTVYSGYQEWWNTGRTMEFSVGIVNDDGTVTQLAAKELSINGSTTADAHSLDIELTQPATVRISVSKVSGGDPVLSWLGVEKIPDPAQETADKSNLEIVVQKALHVQANQDKYMAENWQQLVDALANAQAVLEQTDATQEQVDQAAQDLLDAILAQRFKADKSILEDLIGQVEGMDLSGYSAQSVAAVRTALANAQVVLADESLGEEDQDVVDQAVAQLEAAVEGLSAEGEAQPSQTPAPQATQKPDNQVPQTGDSAQLALWVSSFVGVLLAAAWLAGAALRKIQK